MSSVSKVAGWCVHRMDRPAWLLSLAYTASIRQAVIGLTQSTLLGPPHRHSPWSPCSPDMSRGWWVSPSWTDWAYHRVRASESFVVCDFRGMCSNIYISQVHGSRCRVKFPSQCSCSGPNEKPLFNTKILWDKGSGTMDLIVTFIFAPKTTWDIWRTVYVNW